ncbi:MAG: hypothetical protein DWI68_04475, partial [Chloroflexi bacterium]
MQPGPTTAAASQSRPLRHAYVSFCGVSFQNSQHRPVSLGPAALQQFYAHHLQALRAQFKAAACSAPPTNAPDLPAGNQMSAVKESAPATAVPRAGRQQWVVAAACAVLALAYIHAELYTVYGPFLRMRNWGPPPAWALLVAGLRWPVRFAALAAVLVLCAAEWRDGAVSSALQGVFASSRRTAALLSVLGALTGAYYLLPGTLTVSTDGIYYTTLAWLLRDILASGQLPTWTNWGDMGFPLMQFYSPLFFATLALVSSLVPNIWVAAKALLFALHVASVAAMFAFVRRLSASPLAALCAAAAFGCAYYRYHNIVFVGKLVMAPTFLLWPLQLLLVEHVLSAQPSRRTGAALGLVTAAALAAHVYFGFYASIFAALYGLVRAPTLHSSPALAARAILRLAGWMALGVLAALFYTLPAALENSLTTQGGWYSGGYVQRVADWPVREIFAAVFTWDGGQSRWWQWGYVGNSILLLAAAGGLAAAASRRPYARGALLLLVVGLFLSIGPYTALFSSQGQFAVFVLISACVGTGVFVAELEAGPLGARLVRWLCKLGGPPRAQPAQRTQFWVTALVAAVSAMIAFDMLRHTLFVNFQVPPSVNASPENRTDAHAWLMARRGTGDGRVLDQTAPENGWQVPMLAGMPGFENNGDSPVMTAPFLRNLRPSGPNPWGIRAHPPAELFGEAFPLLLLANVDYVITDAPTPLAQRPEAVQTADGAVIVPTGGGLPMLASARARVEPPPLYFAPLASAMQIAPATATAEFLPVRAPVAALPAAAASAALALTVHTH